MLAKYLPVGAIALSYGLQYAEAAPGLTPKSLSPLNKRFNSWVGCNGDQMSKARQAAADMAELANIAYNEASPDKYG